MTGTSLRQVPTETFLVPQFFQSEQEKVVKMYVAVIKSHLLSGSNEKIIEKLIEKKVKFWICCEIWRLYKENDTLDKRRFVADDQDDDYSRNCFSGLKGEVMSWEVQCTYGGGGRGGGGHPWAVAYWVVNTPVPVLNVCVTHTQHTHTHVNLHM